MTNCATERCLGANPPEALRALDPQVIVASVPMEKREPVGQVGVYSLAVGRTLIIWHDRPLPEGTLLYADPPAGERPDGELLTGVSDQN